MTSGCEDLLLPEQRDRIVAKVVNALKSNGQLPAKTVNRFRDALKAGKPIPGFNNNPLRAQVHLLKQNIIERMEHSPEFAFIITDIWAETKSELRDLVRRHFEGLELPTDSDEEAAKSFWDEQGGAIAAEHSEFDAEDVLLMVRYLAKAMSELAAANLNQEDDGTANEPSEVAMDTAPAVLSDALNRLRALPAESAAWDEEIPQFAEAMNNIIYDKIEEHNRLRSRILIDDITDLDSFLIPDMAFFGRSAAEWNTDNLTTDAYLPEATRLVSELKAELQTYRSIKDRADTLAEERERREQRHDLEDTIERLLTEIDALVQSAGSQDSAPPDAETLPLLQSANESELQDELRALKEDYDSLLRGNKALEQSNASIADANHTLQGEVAGLEADRQTLTEEIAELKDRLRISEAHELSWRNAYEAEVSNRDSSAPEPIPPEVESVNQALELAKARYGDKLLLHLNKKSDPDYNYNRPKEVWDALEWLATTYHPTQTGEFRVVDLNESIRSACSGWEYKPNQTDITFNTYREWYTTTRDGITYELRKHIGKGTGRDSNIIRIAFAWDDELRRVVVGYIGPHQRNRIS